ncbi:type II toxin-antitoxin system VapC family toxin [Sandarakinorhabdus sp.]|uniref:type II toxin-antitoxin system VapC family toxin n=1 Tax=Sandarakinorhabdus sp. TaxID=1916663 RepID=UPI003342879D
MASDARYLLDTNICIYILDAKLPILRRRVEQQPLGSLVTSTIVLAEILRGTDPGDRIVMARLNGLLDIVPALPFDAAAAETYARLPFRRGRFDRLIAAHALSRGLAVVTANAPDFADIPGLAVEDWMQP